MKVLRRRWFLLFLMVATAWARDALVVVRCGRAWLSVTVPAAILGSHVVDGDLTLGSGCGVTAATRDGYQLEHPLTGCGTTLELLQDVICYSNVLHYRPSAGGPVARARPFSLPINCSYPRKGSVSSGTIQPTWVPTSPTIAHRTPLSFALDVYDSTWASPLSHPTYSLGEMINVEVLVSSSHHQPVKVFVDECVVTPSAAPWRRHKVIADNGCLLGRSRFLPRRGDRSLRFQLDTLLFPNISSSQIHLHCHLKAVAEGGGDTSSKACSYDPVVATWHSLDGANCSCCGSPAGCGHRRQRRLPGGRGLLGEGIIHLGPLVLLALPSSSPVPTALPTAPEPSVVPPPHPSVPVVRGERRDSGLVLPIPGTTLALVAMCSILAAVGAAGCYCSVRRRRHAGDPQVARGEPRDVAMAPTMAGGAEATTPRDLSSPAVA